MPILPNLSLYSNIVDMSILSSPAGGQLPALHVIKPFVFTTQPLMELFVDDNHNPVLELMIIDDAEVKAWVYCWVPKTAIYQLIDDASILSEVLKSSQSTWVASLTVDGCENAWPDVKLSLSEFESDLNMLKLDHPLEVRRALTAYLAYYQQNA